jgi:hypothetical protein
MQILGFGKKRRLGALVAALSLAGGGLVLSASQAHAAQTPQPYNFQLDGDISNATAGNFSSVVGTYDWNNFFTACGGTGPACPAGELTGDLVQSPAALPAGYIKSSGKPDYALPDNTLYTTGSKDTDGINKWQCGQSGNSFGAKDDLSNAYQTAFRDPVTGHLIVFFGAEKKSGTGDNNIGIWLLQDSTIDCAAQPPKFSNRNWTFSTGHQTGDILLGAAFNNGGTAATIEAFKWTGNDATGSLSQIAGNSSNECDTSGELPPSNTSGIPFACAITNTGLVPEIWTSPNKNPSTAGNLDSQEFYEGALDVTALLGLSDNPAQTPCFNTTVTDTRSSASDNATIFDYVRDSLPTCFPVTVNKYIDGDLDPNGANGDIANGPDSNDTTTGPDIGGWQLAVTGPGNANLCTGTTAANTGTLSCSTGTGLTNVVPGTPLTISETVPAATPTNTSPAPATNPAPTYFNTDPGIVPASGQITTVGTTVNKNVTMPGGAATFYVGNECFVNLKFEVDGVPNTAPTAAQAVTVSYSVTGGNFNGPSGTGTVTLKPVSPGSTTWTGMVQNFFVQNDTIAWSWTLKDFSGTVSSPQAQPDITLTNANGYPSCFGSTSASVPLPVLGGTKFKDANHDGVKDNFTDLNGNSLPEPLLGGFTMNLYPNTTCSATAVATATSTSSADTNGFNYSFGKQPPGSYSVKETAKTGWKQTAPVVNNVVQTCVPITGTVADTADGAAAIGNTPLSDIAASFSSETGTTVSSIVCTSNDGTTSLPPTSLTGSYSAPGVLTGTYSCTIKIADP